MKLENYIDKIKNEIKQNILNTGVVCDDTYLDKYCVICASAVVNKGKERDSEIGSSAIFNKHHIIPRSYFKRNKLSCDNSPSNIALLSLKNHILAHFYLYKCSSCDWFKYANLSALRYFLKYKNIENIFENDLNMYLDQMKSDYAHLNSEHISKEKHPNWGKKLPEETRKKISNSLKNSLAFKKSIENRKGKPLSAETRKKISSSNKGKINRVFDDKERLKQHYALLEKNKHKIHIYKIDDKGVINSKFICPDKLEEYIELGYIKGNIINSIKLKGKIQTQQTKEKRSKTMSTLKWYNNGIINIRVAEKPADISFVEGRIPYKWKRKVI